MVRLIIPYGYIIVKMKNPMETTVASMGPWLGSRQKREEGKIDFQQVRKFSDSV